MQVLLFLDHALAEVGKFGVFTDNTPVNNKQELGASADFFIWNTGSMGGGDVTPYEGSNVLALNYFAPGQWFGGAVQSRQVRDMSGFRNGHIKLKIKVPAGVEEGTRIRLAGEGEAGLRGAPSGDLYIFLNVAPHSLFERDGADLHCHAVIPVTTAMLGGSIELESEPVIGTKITLTLPLTRAIVTALLVQVADGMFAIPLTSISEVNALEESQIRMIDTTEVLSRRGSSLELCRLRHLFGLASDAEPARQFVVEVMAGTRHLGLVVDALSGQQDIIIRPLGRSLHAVRGFSGASELADERIALVLDPGALIEEAAMSSSGRERGGRFLASG